MESSSIIGLDRPFAQGAEQLHSRPDSDSRQIMKQWIGLGLASIHLSISSHPPQVFSLFYPFPPPASESSPNSSSWSSSHLEIRDPPHKSSAGFKGMIRDPLRKDLKSIDSCPVGSLTEPSSLLGSNTMQYILERRIEVFLPCHFD